MDGSTENGSGSKTLRVVGLLAAIAGGAGALLGGLAAAGYIDGPSSAQPPTSEATTRTSDDPPEETRPETTQQPETTPPPTTQPPTTRLPTTQPPTTRPPTTQPPPPARGTINILYRTEGVPNCTLTPEITIGDRTALPSAFAPAISDLLLGVQNYSISGIIECVDNFGVASWCNIDGSGQIDVADGRSFFLVWNFPTAQFGVCNMWLSDV